MNALIIGGSRGIGKALRHILEFNNWHVTAYGRADYDVLSTSTADVYRIKQDAINCGKYDAFIFCAGDLSIYGIDAFRYPVSFYKLVIDDGALLFNRGCKIIAISSVASVRPAVNNAYYAAAKAALEHFVVTLQCSSWVKSFDWHVTYLRFDWVETDMIKNIPHPAEQTISAEEAAKQIAFLLSEEATPRV